MSEKVIHGVIHCMPTYTGDEEMKIDAFPLPESVSFDDLEIDEEMSDLPCYLQLNGDFVEVWSPPNNAISGIYVTEVNK